MPQFDYFYHHQHVSMPLNYVAAVVSNLLLYCISQWMAVLRMVIAPTATTTIGSDCLGVI